MISASKFLFSKMRLPSNLLSVSVGSAFGTQLWKNVAK